MSPMKRSRSIRCMRAATPRSAASPAPAPSSRASPSAPAAGGGKTTRRANAACMSPKPQPRHPADIQAISASPLSSSPRIQQHCAIIRAGSHHRHSRRLEMPSTLPETELHNPQTAKTPLDPHLKALENEAIHIFREVAAEFDQAGHALFGRQGFIRADASGAQGLLSRPRAVPAFCTSNTGWKFREMIAFREQMAQEIRSRSSRAYQSAACARTSRRSTHGSNTLFTDVMKTEGLRQALDKYGFDAAFGGARRDEEASRAKERIYSFRTPSIAGIREPAPGTLERSITADPQGRKRARFPAVELDRGRYLALHPGGRVSRSCRSTMPRNAPTSNATA
jgi:hypothetical protein